MTKSTGIFLDCARRRAVLACAVIACACSAQEKTLKIGVLTDMTQRLGRHHGRRLGARGADGRRGRRRHGRAA